MMQHRASLRSKVGALVLVAVAAFSGLFVFVSRYSSDVVHDLAQQRASEKITASAETIRWLDEVLTHSASRFVLTRGDEQWARRYDQYVGVLDDAIRSAKATADPADFRLFAEVDGANKALVAMESQVFELTRQGRFVEAEAILSGPYEQQKAIYKNGVDAFFDAQQARNDALAANSLAEARRSRIIAMSALGSIIVLLVVVSMVALSRLLRRVRQLKEAAQAMASGDLEVRAAIRGNDEIDDLGVAFNDMAENLRTLVHRLRDDADRDAFSTELVEALEMPDTEIGVREVAEKAMSIISDRWPIELLLADSSEAHMFVAGESPAAGGPGCPVESMWKCAAIRRGRALTFDSSEGLSACPKLQGRRSGPCSALCVPATFMGQTLGVLHATAPLDDPLSATAVHQLSALAAQSGARIGTVRAVQKTQLQASTDSVTGLLTRRAFEARGAAALEADRSSVVMADLDHFKNVNDNFGHHVGDRALRMFARVVIDSLRADDVVGRYGGDEFAIVLPRLSALQAVEALNRVRASLVLAVAGGEVPAFTASFGVVETHPGDSVLDALQGADAALLDAKRQGRDRVVVGRSVDVTVFEDIDAVAQEVEEQLGHVQILVNDRTAPSDEAGHSAEQALNV